MNAALLLLLFRGGITTETVVTASYYPVIQGTFSSYLVIHGSTTAYSILQG